MEAVLKKVSAWDKAEGMLQAAEDEAAIAVDSRQTLARALSMEEQLAKKRQIFAPQEAYKMLARELKDMMLTPSNGVAVDAIGTSVWQWDMWLTDFDASSLVAQASPSAFLTALLCTNAHPLGTASVPRRCTLQVRAPLCLCCWRC